MAITKVTYSFHIEGNKEAPKPVFGIFLQWSDARIVQDPPGIAEYNFNSHSLHRDGEFSSSQKVKTSHS